MKTTKEQELIPPMKKGQLNVYKPSDIKKWGAERFLNEIGPKEPIKPNFNFTQEEQERIDQLLAENNQ